MNAEAVAEMAGMAEAAAAQGQRNDARRLIARARRILNESSDSHGDTNRNDSSVSAPSPLAAVRARLDRAEALLQQQQQQQRQGKERERNGNGNEDEDDNDSENQDGSSAGARPVPNKTTSTSTSVKNESSARKTKTPSPASTSSTTNDSFRTSSAKASTASTENTTAQSNSSVDPELHRLVTSVIRAQNHYEVLQLKFSESSSINGEHVKKAYRKLALRLHPDKCSHSRAEEAFKRVSAAFACLSDEGVRRRYDASNCTYDANDPGASSSRSAQAQHFSAGGMRGGGMHGGGNGFFYHGQAMTPEELFSMLFGDPFAMRHRHPTQHRQQQQQYPRQRQHVDPLAEMLFRQQRQRAHPGGNGNANNGSGLFTWFLMMLFAILVLPGLFGTPSAPGKAPFVLEQTTSAWRAGYTVKQNIVFAAPAGSGAKPGGAKEPFSIPYWITPETHEKVRGNSPNAVSARRNFERDVETAFQHSAQRQCDVEKYHERQKWWRQTDPNRLPHCQLLERLREARKSRR